MPKSLPVTPRMEALLKQGTGDPDFIASAVAVFETVLADTRPLQKRGSIYDKGTLSASLLRSAADLLNSGKSVPLHTLHQQGDELPVGRVFYGEVREAPDGHTELLGYFYVGKDKTDLVQSLENSTINSVSVAVRPKKLLCSECGWDYLGEDASLMNLFDRTCENGHVVGENGVHVRSIDLDRFYEVSLVSEGAVPEAKIASRATARLTSDEREKLAASGIQPEATIILATTKEEARTMTTSPGGAESATTIASLAVDLGTARAQVSTLTSERDALKAEGETLKAKVAELTEQLKNFEKTQAQVAQFAAVEEFLGEHCKAALVALGETDPSVPETLEEKVKVIKETSVKLHQLIPDGGKARGADAGDKQKEVPIADLGAFRIRK